MVIKVVALDIYGTVLASDDNDNELGPRKGLESFFEHCSKMNALIVSASDNPHAVEDIDEVIKKRSWEDLAWLLEGFRDHYCLQENPKDFQTIIYHEEILPEELLVIGDNWQKDIGGGLNVGARTIYVPEYRIKMVEGDFNFENVRLDELSSR